MENSKSESKWGPGVMTGQSEMTRAPRIHLLRPLALKKLATDLLSHN